MDYMETCMLLCFHVHIYRKTCMFPCSFSILCSLLTPLDKGPLYSFLSSLFITHLHSLTRPSYVDVGMGLKLVGQGVCLTFALRHRSCPCQHSTIHTLFECFLAQPSLHLSAFFIYLSYITMVLRFCCLLSFVTHLHPLTHPTVASTSTVILIFVNVQLRQCMGVLVASVRLFIIVEGIIDHSGELVECCYLYITNCIEFLLSSLLCYTCTP